MDAQNAFGLGQPMGYSCDDHEDPSDQPVMYCNWIWSGNIDEDVLPSRISTGHSNEGPELVDDLDDPTGPPEEAPQDDGPAADSPGNYLKYKYDEDDVSSTSYAATEQPIMHPDWIVAGISEDVLGWIAAGTFRNDDSGYSVSCLDSKDQGPGAELVEVADRTGPAKHDRSLPESSHAGAVGAAGMMGTDVNDDDDGSAQAVQVENIPEVSHGNAVLDSPQEADSATPNEVPVATVPAAGATNGATSSGSFRKRGRNPAGAPAGMNQGKAAMKASKYHGVIERAGVRTTFKAYFRPKTLPDSDDRFVLLGEFKTRAEAWNAFNLMAFVHEGAESMMNNPDIPSIMEEAAAWYDCYRVALLAHLRLRGNGFFADGTPYYRNIKRVEDSKGHIKYQCNVSLDKEVVDRLANDEKEKCTFETAEEAAKLADKRKYLNEKEQAWTNFPLTDYMTDPSAEMERTWLPLTSDVKKGLWVRRSDSKCISLSTGT